MAKKPAKPKDVDALTHEDATRLNVPTAEMASLYEQQAERLGETEVSMSLKRPRSMADGEERDRDPDLDPQIIWNGAKIKLTSEQIKQLSETGEIEIGDAQLVWRGKDRKDWSDLIVNAPPIYIQEKVHPKVIIDDLKRQSDKAREERAQEARKAGGLTGTEEMPDLFADFNGLDDPELKAEFYSHSQHWTNRMILGDSLQVMASLAEREAMKGKVQCIYFDPPYGIKFNSNWQVSTMSRDVKDGKKDHISREPEMVKAFRDTWKDGIHSYLTYLRDRLMVARELLTESGSIFVQIGDENVHRVRALMDEVFGEENFVVLIGFQKTGGIAGNFVESTQDYIIWYAKNKEVAKFRQNYIFRQAGDKSPERYDQYQSNQLVISSVGQAKGEVETFSRFQNAPLYSDGESPNASREFAFGGVTYQIRQGTHWKTTSQGMIRLKKAHRIISTGKTIRYKRFVGDFPVIPLTDRWDSMQIGVGLNYVVETSPKVIQRCILMATDPGDIVLDPTCGSGTTATVAEQWGRRWITIDTSRVALALARARLMGARYPWYFLSDSKEGRNQEQKVTGNVQPDKPTSGDIRQGFVYERAPHITLKSIANNAEIDVIWERWQKTLVPLRNELNEALGRKGERQSPAEAGKNGPWEEWEIPREASGDWSENIKGIHSAWWEARIARQKEIDDSIARAADVEMLYDRPYEDKTKVRVAGPFTVESLSPHRVVTSRDDTLGDDLRAEGVLQPVEQASPASAVEVDFGEMVLENLRSVGVHQQNKDDRISFNSIEPWPGEWLAAEGRYTDGGATEKRAGVLIGPEFGTLTRSQITAAAREASDMRFDALIACAFNFEAQTSDLTRLGPLPILKARMNPDLHMSEDLKNTGKGNLFVVFGEPDIELIETPDGQMQVKVLGVDIFDPSTGEIRSDDADGIAAWFIDTDYNEESFFVRHAYFLGSAKSGSSDPYKALKTALKAEIDKEAWETLYSDVSRPFEKPDTGRIAVKVINHFGDEVLKVFGV